MPCANELQREDDDWEAAKDEHHRRVEAILENFICGKPKPAVERALKAEKLRFAQEYKRIYSDLGAEHIERAMRNIINGKKPYDN